MNYITMNKKELEQAKVFTAVLSGSITQVEAAARLRMTPRWINQKIKRFRCFQEFGLIHKNRGKISSNRLNESTKQLIIKLAKNEWNGFRPTFMTEKLEEIYKVKISKETVRKILTDEGLWDIKQRKVTYRSRRERKSMIGMMVQLDGSNHNWFEGRAKKCTVLVFIDDATSKILWLEFVPSESLRAVMQATKNYIKKHGIPQSMYTDYGSAFHVNVHNKKGNSTTWWQRAIALLSIEAIYANSPQAKGRVERCNRTLQDRLIKEMRLVGISSIDEANQWLKSSKFIENHNRKFSVQAAIRGDAHASIEGYDLDEIFEFKETRTLSMDFTISYNNQILQLHNRQNIIIKPKTEIIIKVDYNGKINLFFENIPLFFNEIKKSITVPEICGTFLESRVKSAQLAVEAR
jgi:hypothetical protein